MKFVLLATLALGTAHAAPPRDHERARAARAGGEFVPLESVLADAQRREPGRVLDVELEADREYEIEILRADGTRVELEYDARSGELLEIEADDD